MKKINSVICLLVCIAVLLISCASNTGIVELEKAITMSETEISNEIVGKDRSEIVDDWGEPNSSLFGVHGDVYALEDGYKHIIVYYNPDGVAESITVVKVD